MAGPDKPILVVGGGIAGMTAAVEAAEVGCRVLLVEKDPFLGGRTVRNHRYFPKMCPPTCGYEINVRRIRTNPAIEVLTMTTVEEIRGKPGAFRVRVRQRPRYVTGDRSLEESIGDQLTSERPDEFNCNIGTTKALYWGHDSAYPPVAVLERDLLAPAEVETLQRECPPGSIDLDQAEDAWEVDASAIIIATGWKPYEATRLEELGFGRHPDVVSNVMLERMVIGAEDGPVLRPSDGQPAQKVAFVQCAGSRDEDHLPYCSAVCCMGSLKQVRYLREQNPDAQVTVFYIDIRTVGRHEKFYTELLEDEQVRFVKGKVAKLEVGAGPGGLTPEVEDTLSAEILHDSFDLVVLATGMVPNGLELKEPLELGGDEHGFLSGKTDVEGIFAVGCASHPCDVSRATKDSTAAALKAIRCAKG